MRMFPSSKKRQQGIALLFSCLALLLLVSVVTVYATNAVINQQKLLANNYRSTIAFEAAEAGLEYGLAFFKQNKAAILVDRGGGKIDGYTFTSTYPALTNNATFSVAYTSPIVNDLTVVMITATGYDSENSAHRTLSLLIKGKAIFTSLATANTVTVRNTVSTSGNVSITNNNAIATANAGGAVSFSGSSGTQASINGTGSVSSSKNGLAADVTQNNNALSSGTTDAFFTSIFGASRTAVQSQAGTVLNNSTSTSYNTLNGVTKQIIWINQSGGTASINASTTIGSTSAPVILIVNLTNGAQLSINGSTTINGLLYVASNWNNGGGGNATINGNAIVEGNFSSTGNLSVNYNSTIAQNLKTTGSFYKAAGGWNDIDP